jgi:hypothetical protein
MTAATLSTVPAIRRSSRATRPTASTSVRLTRRGKLVILFALVVAGVLLVLAGPGLFGGSAAAGTTPSSPVSRYVVVQPGQTLWQIAGQVAPNADRRETIARIVDLNALPGSVVAPGQRIAVPTH